MKNELVDKAFTVFSEGFMAVWQAGFLFGAFICFGIGALILGASLARRGSGIRVKGEIVGVRKKGSVYNAVYRYILPDGQVVEATASEGSSSLGKMKTGQIVPLLVAKDNPEDVVRADGIAMEVIGFFLAAAGVGMGVLAINAGGGGMPGGLTWLVLGVFALMIASRVRGVIIPKDQRLSLAEWQAKRRRERREENEGIALARVEDARGAQEGGTVPYGAETPPLKVSSSVMSDLMPPQEKTASPTPAWAGPLMLLAAIAFLGGAWHLGQGILRLEAEGLRAPGVVIRVERGSGSDAAYFPVVEFRRADGMRQVFRSSVGTSPPSHKKGEKVKVLYLADSPGKSARIDRGPLNWLLPGILGFLGALMLMGGLSSLLKAGPGDKAL